MKTRKTTKKTLALLMALVMVIGLMPTSFAAITGGSGEVSLNLTNITADSNPAQLLIEGGEGGSTVQLTADAGYILPAKEAVAVVGADSFSYVVDPSDPAKGTLSIGAGNIAEVNEGAANIEISVTMAAIPVFTVTWDLTNVTASPKPTYIPDDESSGLSVTLAAASGFRLPDDVTVTGASEKSYDKATGALSVASDKITGNITVTASAVQTYAVTFNVPESITVSGATVVDNVSEYSATLTANSGELPPTLVVEGVAEGGYSYDPATGAFTIAEGKVTGAVTVTAAYNVTVGEGDEDYISVDGAKDGVATAAYGSSVTFAAVPGKKGDVREGYIANGFVGTDGISSLSENVYGFTMPAENVELYVSSWKFTDPAVTVNGEEAYVDGSGVAWFKAADVDNAVVAPVAPATLVSANGGVSYSATVKGVVAGENQVMVADEFDVQAALSFTLDNDVPTAELHTDDTNAVQIGKKHTYTMRATDSTGSGIKSIKYYVTYHGDTHYVNDGFKDIPAGKLNESNINKLKNKLSDRNWKSTTVGGSVELTSNKSTQKVFVCIEDNVGNIAYYCIDKAVFDSGNDAVEFNFSGDYTLNNNIVKTIGNETKSLLIYNKSTENGEKELDSDIILATENEYGKKNLNKKPTFSLYTGKADKDGKPTGTIQSIIDFITETGSWGKDKDGGIHFFYGISSENNELTRGFSKLADGVYTLFANLEMNNKKMSDNISVFVNNSKPGASASYSGMAGYDTDNVDGSVTYTAGGTKITDTKTPAEAEAFISTHKLYTNGAADTTVAFGSVTYKDSNENKSVSGYPFTSSAKVNDSSEAITGITVKKTEEDTKVESVVIGSDANEGSYEIKYSVKGFNEQEQTMSSTVVVDKTVPAAAENIVVKAFNTVKKDGVDTYEEVESNGSGWTNGDKIELSLSDIADANLREDCVTLYSGSGDGKQKIDAPASVTDGVWNSTKTETVEQITTKTFAINGEQNQTYTVEVADKAGNKTEKTLTVMIDTQKPASIETTTKDEQSDGALIEDIFTFGIFHTTHDAIIVDPSDAGSGENVSGFNTENGSEAVKYAFIESDNEVYQKLRYKLKEEPAESGIFVPDTTKPLNAAGREAAVNAYMETLGMDSLTWNTAEVNDGKFETIPVPANKEFIAVFAVTDKAGNTAFFERSFLIHDTVNSNVSFEINTLPAATEGTTGIYTADVEVAINVNDPDAFSGVNAVSYEVYRSEAEKTAGTPFASGSLKQVNASTESDTLLEQGEKTFSDKITLADKDAENVIDSNNIFIIVSVEDIAGNTEVYDSRETGITVTNAEKTESAQINVIAIDKSAPVVTLNIDNMNALNGKYYPAVRNMTLTVSDLHFDPETCISFIDNCTGAVSVPENDDDAGKDRIWSKTEPDEFGNVTYTATVKFGEGNHKFGFKEIKDTVGQYAFNSAEAIDDVKYTFNDTEDEKVSDSLKDFVVDLTAPIVMLNFARADGKAFGEYNNSSVVITATVMETNFDSSKTFLTVNGQGIALAWMGGNGSYTASYTVTEDNVYNVSISSTDLAGNAGKPYGEAFVIDKTKPEIKITGVEDKSAYNAEEILPVIEVTDTNYDIIGVEVTLAGSNGGSGYYDSVDIENGEKFSYENIEDDDMYTLTVVAKDLAENESTQTIVFSVNRNGSVFTANEALAKAMENGIPYYRTDNLPQISLFETNVDIIKEAKLYLTKDSSNIDLTDKDYKTVRKDVNGGWSQYEYILNKELFADDGVYRVSLVTVDAAGNEKNAEEVVAFVVDNTAPVLFVNDLKSGGIYNEETKHVVFTPNDNIVLSKISVMLDGKEIASWNSEQIAQLVRDGGEFGFDVPESNALRELSIVLTDAAGNTNENPLFEDVLVSTNFFVRFYNNKPVFYGTLGGLVAVGGGLWFFLAKKKKKEDEAEGDEEV